MLTPRYCKIRPAYPSGLHFLLQAQRLCTRLAQARTLNPAAQSSSVQPPGLMSTTFYRYLDKHIVILVEQWNMLKFQINVFLHDRRNELKDHFLHI